MTDKTKEIDLREVDAFLTKYFPYDKYERNRVDFIRSFILQFAENYPGQADLSEFIEHATTTSMFLLNSIRKTKLLYDEALQTAKSDPEKHKNLLVRVNDCEPFYGYAEP